MAKVSTFPFRRADDFDDGLTAPVIWNPGTTNPAAGEGGSNTGPQVGDLFVDTDLTANGTLLCYANGAWRTVSALT